MEKANEIKNIIREANTICIIPNDNEPESISSALALFYTLRELNKNVNLILDDLPKKLNFLTPSIDFINTPKNFVISIPRSSADVSQIYYEKNEDNLKIHLTIDKGQIKKESLSFYFEDAKPDLIITLGIQDFQKQLSQKLNSFGFLLGSSILNIDNDYQVNKKFGTVNIIEPESITELTLEIINIAEGIINKNAANCLLAGLIIYYENFKSHKTSADVFDTAADLIKKGAKNTEIIDNLYRSTDDEINILGNILKNIQTEENISVALIEGNDTSENIKREGFDSLIDKLKNVGVRGNLLVLWQNKDPEYSVDGFFYSTTEDLIKRITDFYKLKAKNGLVWISIKNSEANSEKDRIINLLKEKKTNVSIYADSLK